MSSAEECSNLAWCFLKSSFGIFSVVISGVSLILNPLYIHVRIKKKDVMSHIATVLLSSVNIMITVVTYTMTIILGFLPLVNMKMTYFSAGVVFGYCVQVLLLLFICIDRYIAIIKPLHYHQIITKKRVTIAVVGSVIIGVMVATVIVLIPSRTPMETLEYAISHNITTFTLRLNLTDGQVLFWRLMFAPFVIIAIVMCGCYFVIIMAIRKQLKKSNATLKDYKGTLVLFLSMVYFLMSYLPLFIIYTLPQTLDLPLPDPTITILLIVINASSYSTGFVNILLYGVSNKSFWVALCSICVSKNKISVEDGNPT